MKQRALYLILTEMGWLRHIVRRRIWRLRRRWRSLLYRLTHWLDVHL